MKLRAAVKEQNFKSEKEARLFCEKQEKLLGLEQEIADYKKRLHKLLGQIKILEKTLLGQKKTVGRRKTEKAWTDRTKSGKNQAGIKRNL